MTSFLHLPRDIILFVFDYLDDTSWLYLRMTCKYLDTLSGERKDAIRRLVDAHERADDTFKGESIGWFNLYREVRSRYVCRHNASTRNWMAMYTKVYNMTNTSKVKPDSKTVLRCINLLSKNEQKYIKMIFQYYLRKSSIK